jgi:SAM-dependent methyltransferase
MDSAASIAEPDADSTGYVVPSEIHPEDFLFLYHVDAQTGPDREQARKVVLDYYLIDGERSAQRLDELVRQFHGRAATERLSLLEFASGYGCVSRHLRRMDKRYDLVSSDIHPQAIQFLRERLDVNAVLSASKPRDFVLERRFDVVFALSFFSHMPNRSFGDWLAALFGTLADDGLLIFTAHGREQFIDLDQPTLEPEGYWYAPFSEQKDIPVDDYGIMIAPPLYVMDQIARIANAAVVLVHEANWWGKQDLYIVRKSNIDLRPRRGVAPLSVTTVDPKAEADVERLRAELARCSQQAAHDKTEAMTLRGALDAAHRSTSWRMTAPLRALGELLKRG